MQCSPLVNIWKILHYNSISTTIVEEAVSCLRAPIHPLAIIGIILTMALGKYCGFYTFFFSGFSTGLVRLYIAGLPVRSYRTIGAPSVQGSAQCAFFRFWPQQDSNPCPSDNHANVLPLRHFDICPLHCLRSHSVPKCLPLPLCRVSSAQQVAM